MTEHGADFDLLRDYVDRQSQRSFGMLVERHLGLVYSTAFRQLGDQALAEEVAHVTFIVLARKAHTLRRGTVLAGWLYRTARFVAQDAIKMNARRKQREIEAAQLASPIADDHRWAQIEPFLDEAVTGLGEQERSAVLLRFFENKSLAEVGAALGVSEEAARKRLTRALEKLRGLLRKRGASLTAASLAALLSANAASAAPPELAAAVTASVAAKGAAAAPVLALTNATLKLMTWMKIKAAIIVAAIGLCSTATTIVALKARAAASDQPGLANAAATVPPRDQPAAATVSTSPSPSSPPAGVASEQTLGSITLSLDFNEASLAEAVHYLIVEAKLLDPAHAGFDFIISPAATKSAQPITLKLDNVTLQQAIDSICDSANVKYTLGNGAVRFYALTENTPVPALPNNALPTETPSSKATLAKLRATVIDKVNFQNLDIQMVLLILTAESKQFDPDHKGVNFVLGYIAPDAHIHRNVSVTLDNIPLSDLLTYINQQTNLRYSLGDNVVTFKP